MKRALAISWVATLAYLGVSSLLHYVVFPEPLPARASR
jgi:hypothetical protein